MEVWPLPAVALKNLVLVDCETNEPNSAERACEYTPFGSVNGSFEQPL